MKSVLIFLFACIGVAVNAQKIHHLRTVINDKKIVVRYEISGVKGQVCRVQFFVSVDEGKTFDMEITDAKGDIGDNIKVGKKKKIEWDASNTDIDFSKVKVRLQIQAIGLPPKKKNK